MKINKAKKAVSKLSSIAENRESSAVKAAPPSKLSWLTKGENKIKARYQQQQSDNRRAPELWLVAGKPTRVRFRTSEPLGALQAYRYQIGNRWAAATAPAPGERDLFDECGMHPSQRVIYEVIDVEGYTDKEGKQRKNLARFFVVGSQLFQQLSEMAKQLGGLTKREFIITRTGAGKTTSYTIIPKDKDKAPYDYSKVPSIAADVEKYYAPPTVEQQKRILGSLGKLNQEDES